MSTINGKVESNNVMYQHDNEQVENPNITQKFNNDPPKVHGVTETSNQSQDASGAQLFSLVNNDEHSELDAIRPSQADYTAYPLSLGLPSNQDLAVISNDELDVTNYRSLSKEGVPHDNATSSRFSAVEKRSLDMQNMTTRHTKDGMPSSPPNVLNCTETDVTNVDLDDPSTPFSGDRENKEDLLSAEYSLKQGDDDDVFLKSTVFHELTEWEKSRLRRTSEAEGILDPLVDGLFVIVQNSKDANQQFIRYFKDRVKLQHDIVTKLRAFRGIRGTTTIKPASFGSTVETTLTDTESLDYDGSDLKSSLAVTSQNWITLLHHSLLNEATYFEGLTEAVEGDSITGNLHQVARDYEKTTSVLLQHLNEARLRVKSQLVDIINIWLEFQKVLSKEEDKTEKNFVKQYSEEQPNLSSTADALPKRLQTVPSVPVTHLSTSRYSKDPWLLERKYIHSAMTSHQMHVAYHGIVFQTVLDLQHLENWRSFMLRNCVMEYINKFTEVLRNLARGLGSLHSTIDPDGFQQLIDDHTSGINVNSSCGKEKQDEPRKEDNLDVQTYRSNYDNIQELLETHNDSQSCRDNFLAKRKTVLPPKLEERLHTALVLIDYDCFPEPRLAVKMSHVRRMTGYFGKWSEGLLVLTWDRYLHMFRAYDDATPLWSITVPQADVRVTEETGGVKTIEVREKRSLFNMLNQRSYLFRAVSSSDHSSWMNALTLATKADDSTLRREGTRLASFPELIDNESISKHELC